MHRSSQCAGVLYSLFGAEQADTFKVKLFGRARSPRSWSEECLSSSGAANALSDRYVSSRRDRYPDFLAFGHSAANVQ